MLNISLGYQKRPNILDGGKNVKPRYVFNKTEKIPQLIERYIKSRALQMTIPKGYSPKDSGEKNIF